MLLKSPQQNCILHLYPLLHQTPNRLRKSYSSYYITKLKAMGYSHAPDNPIVSKSIITTN